VLYRMEREEGHERDFLTVGSMGHACSIALGIAMQKPNRQVIYRLLFSVFLDSFLFALSFHLCMLDCLTLQTFSLKPMGVSIYL